MTDKKTTTRRERRRNRGKFPIGMYVALLTAVMITLIGVCMDFEPQVILSRAALSSVLLGLIVSFGVSIIRITDADYKERQQPRRR